jgi:hypothetical protein
MSETITNPNSKRPNYRTRKILAGLALATTGAAVAGAVVESGPVGDAFKDHSEHSELVDNLKRPDALAEYRKGDGIPHDKAVVLQAPESMTPFDFAEEIDAEGVDLRDITEQITPQADAQLDPGLQPHEQVVVEKALVSEEAIDKFGVPDLSDPNYVTITPPEHQ